MNSTTSSIDYARVHDEARRRANELRQEAIDAFFAGAVNAARRGLRAANRLAHSLARHRRLRTHQAV